MSARNVVITGGTRGIGRAVALELARQGHRVVLLGRDRGAGEVTAHEARSAGGAGSAFVEADLSSVRGVHAAAGQVSSAAPQIDVLIHNAGLWPARRELSEEGLERAFVVNHLAPFALNLALEPALSASRARVVQVSAGLYVKGRVDLERTPRGDDFHAIRTYATTKLFNLLCLPRFAARFQPSGVRIDAVHPGVIRTGLGDRPGLAGAALRLIKWLWKAPAQGAVPVVRLALEPGEETGRYFHELERRELAPVAADAALASRVWEQALAFVGPGPARAAGPGDRPAAIGP